MTEISIVLGVRGRPANTRRCLEAIELLTYKDYEVLFMDVVGEQNQKSTFDQFKDRLPIRYVPLEENWNTYIEDYTTWTPATTWNTGIKKSEGKFVITTAADILFSHHDALEKFIEQYRGNRISATTYFLSNEITDSLDVIDWKSDIAAVLGRRDFGCVEERGRTNQDPLPVDIITFLTGMEKSQWEYIGGFRKQLSHLVNDQDLHLRESFLGRKVDTWNGCYAIHQAHPIGEKKVDVSRPGWHYETEAQARLLEPAPRDTT